MVKAFYTNGNSRGKVLQKKNTNNITFSIIIPVKAINSFIREAVSYIQNLEVENWELIILPNELERDEWCDHRILVVASGKVGPAAKRDQGAIIARGEYLVFLDDDSFPSSNLLTIAASHFLDSSVVAIGGPAVTPETDNFWQRVSGAVFLSKLSGGHPERYVPCGKEREVDDWPSVNLIVRRRDFLDVGGFDSPYWPGEDTKLCLELVKKTQKKILYVPTLLVWHHRRAGIIAHLKQIGAYGLHRGHFFRRYPENSRKFKYLLPSGLFLATFGAFAATNMGLTSIVFWSPLILIYVLVLIYSIFEISKYENLKVALVASIYIPLTHLYYGFRFIQGLLTLRLNSKLR